MLYKQEDGTYNEVKPTFVGATENHSISYRIIMDNYTEYNNTNLESSRFDLIFVAVVQQSDVKVVLCPVNIIEFYIVSACGEFVWEIKPRPINIIWTVDEYVYDGTLKTPIASVDP